MISAKKYSTGGGQSSLPASNRKQSAANRTLDDIDDDLDKNQDFNYGSIQAKQEQNNLKKHLASIKEPTRKVGADGYGTVESSVILK